MFHPRAGRARAGVAGPRAVPRPAAAEVAQARRCTGSGAGLHDSERRARGTEGEMTDILY